HLEPRALDDRLPFAIAPLRVLHDQRSVPVHDDEVAVFRLNVDQTLEPDRAGVPRFERRLLGHARRGAADMEGPHGQLGARLADRLRGDDADRLTELDRLAGSKVTAVALRAHAAARRA